MGVWKRSSVLIGLVCLTVLPGVARAATPDSWRIGPNMATGRLVPSIASLGDGRVIVMGGQASGPALNTVEIFDPTSGTWSAGPTMGSGRLDAPAVRLTNGNVLVAGGASGSDTTAEVYNPTLNSWNPTANNSRDPHASNPIAGPSTFSAAALPNGKVLLAGSSASPTIQADLYDTADNKFHPAANMGTARQFVGELLLSNGKVLVAGGFDGTAAISSAEVYDPVADTWTPVSNTMNAPHINPQIAPLPGGKALVFGGPATGAITPTADTEIYDPATNRFTPTGSMNVARVISNVTSLADGRVVVSGGVTGFSTGSAVLSSTEVYEPTSGRWSFGASMLTPQAGGGSARLPSDEVLVLGGEASGGAPPVVMTEIYTPATVPAVPGSVSAVPGDRSALVTWSPPTSTGGSPIVHYTVIASTGQRVTTPDARTNATVTGLSNGRSVTFTITATNGVGTGPASTASNAVTPTHPDTSAPSIVITKLATRVKLKSLLKSGIGFTVKPSESSSLEIALLASSTSAHISKAYNLTLATKTLRRGTGARSVKLKPNRKLLGHAKKFSLLLRVTATDAAGNRRTVSKTVRVRP